MMPTSSDCAFFTHLHTPEWFCETAVGLIPLRERERATPLHLTTRRGPGLPRKFRFYDTFLGPGSSAAVVYRAALKVIRPISRPCSTAAQISCYARKQDRQAF
jgi:hypothetical protein